MIQREKKKVKGAIDLLQRLAPFLDREYRAAEDSVLRAQAFTPAEFELIKTGRAVSSLDPAQWGNSKWQRHSLEMEKRARL